MTARDRYVVGSWLLLAGVVFARRDANPLLPLWVDLGPIPWRAYFLSADAARKRYLGK